MRPLGRRWALLPVRLSEPRPQRPARGVAEQPRISAPDMARPERLAERRQCAAGARMRPRPGWLGERRTSLRREPLTPDRAWPMPRRMPRRRILPLREDPSRMSAAAARKAAAPPSISAAAVVRMAAAALRMAAAAARKAAVAAAVRMAGVAAAVGKASIDAKPGLNLALTVLEQSRATHALIRKRAPQRRRNRTVVARNHSSRPEPLF
jgi:hypothetical protein